MNFVHCFFSSDIVRSEQWVQLYSSFKLDTCVNTITSMASNEVNIENTNVNVSDEILGSKPPVTLNPLILLHVDR